MGYIYFYAENSGYFGNWRAEVIELNVDEETQGEDHLLFNSGAISIWVRQFITVQNCPMH